MQVGCSKHLEDVLVVVGARHARTTAVARKTDVGAHGVALRVAQEEKLVVRQGCCFPNITVNQRERMSVRVKVGETNHCRAQRPQEARQAKRPSFALLCPSHTLLWESSVEECSRIAIDPAYKKDKRDVTCIFLLFFCFVSD